MKYNLRFFDRQYYTFGGSNIEFKKLNLILSNVMRLTILVIIYNEYSRVLH